MTMFTQKDIDQFWSRVDMQDDDDCWEWLGRRDGDGYGCVTVQRKNKFAHRIAYMLATGDDPGKLFVCHTCDNKSCCNPGHLFKGTSADNMQDMIQKGRGLSLVAYGWPEIKEIRRLYIAGESGADIATRFGIHFGTVHRILRNESWYDPSYVFHVHDKSECAGGVKLNWQKVREIRQLHAEGCSQITLAGMFDVTVSSIGLVVSNKQWHDPSYIPQMRDKSEQAGNAKLDRSKVREIRRLHTEGYSQVSLGGMFNVNPSTIGRIVRNKRWTEEEC